MEGAGGLRDARFLCTFAEVELAPTLAAFQAMLRATVLGVDLLRKVQSNLLRSPATTNSNMTGNEIYVNMWRNKE